MERVSNVGPVVEGKRHCSQPAAGKVGEEQKLLELPRQVQREDEAEVREHRCPFKTAGAAETGLSSRGKGTMDQKLHPASNLSPYT